MATMYSLFLGFLLAALCRGNGDGSSVVKPNIVSSIHVISTVVENPEGLNEVRSKDFIGIKYINFLCRSVAAAGPVPFLLTEKEPKGQGLVARLNCLLISGNKTNSLRSNKSDCLSEIIDNSLRLAQLRPFFKASATRTPLQSGLMSPVKLLTLVGGGTTVQSKGSSDDFCFFLGKRRSPSGDEDNNKIKNNKALLAESRQLIIVIASNELGVKEATGHNDGPRVEQYLRYTNLGPGYEWCAAFVSWVYGQAGLAQPCNPWSPALFPKARSYKDEGKIQKADLFGIYSAKLKRINHVGLIKEKQGQYILSIEGNSNNRVESRRRHQRTVYSYADWIGKS